MIILVDSREQKPLKLKHKYITDIVTTALKVGDYRCQYTDGNLSETVFERKSISDLFSTLSKGYTRFKREMERGAGLGIKIRIIVEGTITDVLKGHKYSKRDGKSIIRQLLTIEFKYGIPTTYCSSRAEMSFIIAEFYATIGRNAVDELKAKLKEVAPNV